MKLDMLLHVSFLSEALAADRSLIRFMALMHKCMISEVPTFAEGLVAAIIEALDDLLLVPGGAHVDVLVLKWLQDIVIFFSLEASSFLLS